MFAPDQIEFAIFGQSATPKQLAYDAFLRAVLLTIELQPTELMQFEAYRLAKLHPIAVGNLNKWAFSGENRSDAHVELNCFREALTNARDFAKAGQSAGPSRDGRVLHEALWSYLGTNEEEIRQHRKMLRQEVNADAKVLNSSDQKQLPGFFESLGRTFLGADSERGAGLRDAFSVVQSMSESDEARECPALLFLAALMQYSVNEDVISANHSLRRCIKSSEGARTVTNSMAHRLIAFTCASDGDFGEADFWMLQGATLISTAHGLMEAGLYAGCNNRAGQSRLLFSRGLEMSAVPVINALANEEAEMCSDELLNGILTAQGTNRASGKTAATRWARVAQCAEDASEIAGIENVASKALLKEHHRYSAELPNADMLTAGYMLHRAAEGRRHLIEEVTGTLNRLQAERREVVKESEEAIRKTAALRQIRRNRAKEERDEEVSQAKLTHSKLSSHYRHVELGCSFALGLAVAALGTFLLIAVICALGGSDLKADSGVGLFVVLAGMIPVGLMAATHVVHGIFHQRASGELARMLKVADDRYGAKLLMIDASWIEADNEHKAELKSRAESLVKVHAAQQKFGLSPLVEATNSQTIQIAAA